MSPSRFASSEVRVEREGPTVVKVRLVRQGKDDIDLTDLLAITEIRRVIKIHDAPIVELRVLGHIVEVES